MVVKFKRVHIKQLRSVPFPLPFVWVCVCVCSNSYYSVIITNNNNIGNCNKTEIIYLWSEEEKNATPTATTNGISTVQPNENK